MTDKERLVTEWLTHDKIVLAVDYDDTIFPFNHKDEKACMRVIELVKWCQTIGAYIMIHTASDPSRHEEIIAYCNSHGIKVDSINKNPIDLPYGNDGKPYYNWQLCDRSGLNYAITVLHQAAKEVLSKKRENNNLTEVG
jgi:hypothetical protein